MVVRDVHVDVKGPASGLPGVREALRAFEPKRGERLRDAVYENSKAAVDAELRAAGFFDARTVESRVAVRPNDNTAEIDVVWESGERYRLGRVDFSQNQFGEDFLRGYVPWQPGAPYSAEQVLRLQQRLVNADYFSMVVVQPQIDQADDPTVPVEVTLTPDERTLYTAGLYLSTDTGAGGHAGIERRWLNRRGHKIQGDVEYSQRQQEVMIDYRIPRPGPFHRDYTFGAAYLDEETDTSRARMTALAAAEARERWHGFNRTLGVQFLDSDFDIADERIRSRLIFGEIALSRRISDDELLPRNGYTTTLNLRVSPGRWLSDTDLVQVGAQGKWIHSIDDRNRWLLRGELGALRAGNFRKLPPRLRFFAGGDRSIRGFDYESIGERNASGGVVGGEFLAVASTEYEHFFLPDWGVALFLDGGDAFSSDFDLHVGAGAGVRWRSPIGSVRLDFAKAVEGEGAGGWRIHIVIGPDL